MGRACAASVLVFLTGCSSCGKKEEPARDRGFNPAPPAGQEDVPDAAPPASRFTPQERRDLRIRIGNEDCESAAKRVNRLHNRGETDLKGIEILSVCLKSGNLAWYRCVLDAPSADEVDGCSRRLLHPDPAE
jgi:hypothetical protein